MKLLSWIGLAAAAVVLVACNRPAEEAKAPAMPAAPVVEKAGPVAWNAATGGFELNGKPLRAAKLWTFDGSTDGFTGVKSKITPAAGQGLAVAVVDPSLRSPKGLGVPGGQYPLVIVRLTRTGAGEAWDGALYYTTSAHPESIDFLGKPMGNAKPGLNETVTLAYDMSRQAIGGGDWLASTIDQIRLDIEDKPGGQFVIHQVAIAEYPDAGAPPAAPAPEAAAPAVPADKAPAPKPPAPAKPAAKKL
ncbi:MAG: hypothetical protein JWQ29_1923 [Phenylobacterium sp.]|nr:hypothetical protein [Phenylobacterium sp.]